MDYFSSDKLIHPGKGNLLISEPYLRDPNFDRTVIFLCEHDEEGAIGFVLNKLSEVKLEEVIDGIKGCSANLLIGGPVQRDTLHFIHRYGKLEGAKEVVEEVYWGGDFDQLMMLVDSGAIDLANVRFFAGYSGWTPEQLLGEIKARSWIVMKNVSTEMIFDWDNQNLWKVCLKSMGGKFQLMSNYPKDPRMN